MTPRFPLAAAALLTTGLLGGCGPMVPVCPAIGFVNPGPVTIEVAPALTVGEVAACFGDGCAPTPLPLGRDGRGRMPLAPPYLADTSVVSIEPGTTVRVVITDATGTVTRDVRAEIPYRSEGGGPCPGPVSFDAVVIS
ncbi:hypothetical protein [Microbacterium sp. B24]|uniref:hypothetical protein n=1 Tax=Microbacterium sp. B24 TaxID=95616 RepID=UPI000403589D|nr:hypothetical protein [Microbacterium sp. B24]